MDAIISKFLLAGDKFMQEKHLRQPGFTYSACGLFTKYKEKVKKTKEKLDSRKRFKMNSIKHVFYMIWLIEVLKI